MRLKTTGPVTIHLLDEAAFGRLPHMDSPLVSGKTASDYGFSVVLPESGDYFLIADNRDGDQRREITVHLTATDAPGLVTEPVASLDLANQMLKVVESALKLMFNADALEIRTAPCGAARAFQDSGAIVICTEYAQAVMELLGDAELSSSALLFSLFQEVGRFLLAQTPNAPQDTDELRDELATALMVFLGYRDHAVRQAKYFADPPGTLRIQDRLEGEERHPPTVERAARVLEWVDEPELLARWQRVLLSNLRTHVLCRFRDQPPHWTTLESLDEELSRRAC